MGKKRKCYFNNNTNQAKKANLKFGNNTKIGPGLKGFLITYNSKFTFVINEAKKIIQQFITQKKTEETCEANSTGDIEKLLKAELNSLNVQDKEIKVLDTGAKYTLFIDLKNLDPNEIAESIYGHIESTKKPLGRYVQRMLPVLNTCKSFLPDIELCLKATLDNLDEITNSDSNLGPDLAKPFSYSCIFKSSNNGSISREEIFKLIGAYLQSKNKLNKVDFDRPDLVVFIHVICNVCYISFVRNFYEYKKYNLVEHGNKFNSLMIGKNVDKKEAKTEEKKEVEEEKSDEESDEEDEGEVVENDIKNDQETPKEIS